MLMYFSSIRVNHPLPPIRARERRQQFRQRQGSALRRDQVSPLIVVASSAMPDPTSAALTATPSASAARRSEGRFYVAMALVAMLIVIAGFGPGLVDPSMRRAPLAIPVAAHGVVFAAWLVLFLTQTLLIPKGQFAIHRRLGYAGAVLAVLMVVSGYFTAVAMSRRGYDLSGDLVATAEDALTILVFQLGDLVSFSILVAAAVLYRRRADVHKRLMLLATVGALMGRAISARHRPLADATGH